MTTCVCGGGGGYVCMCVCAFAMLKLTTDDMKNAITKSATQTLKQELLHLKR